MQDACVVHCRERVTEWNTHILTATEGGEEDEVREGEEEDAAFDTWSVDSTDPFSLCMTSECAATEPTKYNPEVTE